jgi:alpha(1,3/1,4) fucosyltransferase
MTQKIILIYTHSKTRYDNLFSTSNKDGRSEYFPAVKEKFIKLGYRIEFANKQNLKNISSVIFLDHYNNGAVHPIKRFVKFILNFFWIKRVLKKKKGLLIIWEGGSVNPTAFDCCKNEVFDKILTWNDSLVDNKKYFKYFLPITENWSTPENVPFNEKKLLVNISYNKKSENKNDLYIFRLNVIKFYNEFYPNLFDLYGHGWNDSDLGVYRGSIERKVDVFPHYKFGLCYENAKDVKGYISEKIFDCMRSNCIPIYYGASNIEEYVPLNTFIDARNFNSVVDMHEYIQEISESCHDEYMSNINNFLRSNDFEKFKTTAFVSTMKSLAIDSFSEKIL